MTSICGLGQVALGPVMSVLGMQRGGDRGAPTRPSERPRRSRSTGGD